MSGGINLTGGSRGHDSMFIRRVLMQEPGGPELIKYFQRKLLQQPLDLEALLHEMRSSETTIPTNTRLGPLIRDYGHSCASRLILNRDSCKSERISRALRDHGTLVFNTNDYVGAHMVFTQSIAMAPSNSEALASAYAERSRVLFYLGRFRDCLLDIKQVYCLPYLASQHRLLFREARCLLALGQQIEAENVLERAKQMVYNNIEPVDERFKLMDILSQAWTQPLPQPAQQETIQKPDPPDLAYGPNREVPSLSAAVDIAYDRYYGRHLVANRDIEIGSVVMVEEPFATTLFRRNRWSHCSHCYKRCYTLKPCELCHVAMFCDQQCYDQAKVYHDLECRIQARLLAMEIELEDSPLALLVRVLTKTGMSGLTECLLDKQEQQQQQQQLGEQENAENMRTRGFEKGQYLSWHWRTPSGLSSHSLQAPSFASIAEERSMELFQLFVTVLEVISCYEAERVFISDPMAVHILELAAKIEDNHTWCLHAHAYVGRHENGSQKLTTAPSAIGLSLSTTQALMNHSCAPNCYVYRCGGKTVVRTTQPVRRGQQLTRGYIMPFYSLSVEKRQALLFNSFGFLCKCEACVKKWPTFPSLPRELDSLERFGYSECMNVLADQVQLARSHQSISEENLAITNVMERILSMFFKLNKVVHQKYVDDLLQLQDAYSRTGDCTYVYGPAPPPLRKGIIRQHEPNLIHVAYEEHLCGQIDRRVTATTVQVEHESIDLTRQTDQTMIEPTRPASNSTEESTAREEGSNSTGEPAREEGSNSTEEPAVQVATEQGTQQLPLMKPVLTLTADEPIFLTPPLSGDEHQWG